MKKSSCYLLLSIISLFFPIEAFCNTVDALPKTEKSHDNSKNYSESEAIDFFIKNTDKWKSTNNFSLGLQYFYGDNVSKNYSRAVEIFTQAANQGNARAQGMLGTMSLQGLGVPQDYSKAVGWFT